ncbi:hypothetical protein GGX14DRAFT_620088 [Mycena pura]|uniref:Uncharacterized protein n=1 Tax=Mycena pura TaxID=153505 RepID=A0AAD6VHF3_9AGAR|nr:hypothetical protein GGX14DRAFT_620088 [Mycena pura]
MHGHSPKVHNVAGPTGFHVPGDCRPRCRCPITVSVVAFLIVLRTSQLLTRPRDRSISTTSESRRRSSRSRRRQSTSRIGKPTKPPHDICASCLGMRRGCRKRVEWRFAAIGKRSLIGRSDPLIKAREDPPSPSKYTQTTTRRRRRGRPHTSAISQLE